MLRFDHANGLVGDQVGRVAFLVEILIVAMPGGNTRLVVVRIRIDLAVKVPIRGVEAVPQRGAVGRRTHVPLAHDGRGVAAVAKGLGQCDSVVVEDPAVGGRGHAEPARIAAAEKPDARRSTRGHHVVPVEADPFLRQTVDVRRSNGRAMVADVGPSHIVGQNENDVGPRRARPRRGRDATPQRPDAPHRRCGRQLQKPATRDAVEFAGYSHASCSCLTRT